MDAYFAELGRTVLARWKTENFSLPAFPEIARAALEERSPAKHVDIEAMIREFLLEDAQPFQTSSGFGQPELIVYDDPRFYIQVLFWLDGTTDIHQHEFSGAFHVLQGSSIHAHFEFENAQSVTAHLRVGDLRMTGIQVLETGSTVPIISGRSCIHSLFHLDTPSISVVVRTHNDPGTGPQFTYLPPHIAVDPVHYDALTIRRKQLLDVLERVGDPGYGALVREMLGELDFERGFFILQNGLGALRTLGEWEETLEMFESRHGELARGVAVTLDEIVRRDALAAFRATVEDVEHRFFLALLMNVGRRADFLGLVAQRFPGEPPTGLILRWAEELIEVSDFGVSILDAPFPEGLDVPVEEQETAFLAALEAILDGKEPPDEAWRDAFTASSLRVLLG